MKLDEVQGGTITITNPGIFGPQFGTPIILQPQVAILATDGIRSDFAGGIRRSDPPERIARAILSGHRKETDDALVLVVRYLGGQP